MGVESIRRRKIIDSRRNHLATSAPTNDPRVYFAAERTLLAWNRSGLSVIGMGFVVARFELNLRQVHTGQDLSPHIVATVIGFSLVFLGSLAMAAAAGRHWRFCRTLRPDERPQPDLTDWSFVFSMILTIMGLILSAYILLRSIGG